MTLKIMWTALLFMFISLAFIKATPFDAIPYWLATVVVFVAGISSITWLISALFLIWS